GIKLRRSISHEKLSDTFALAFKGWLHKDLISLEILRCIALHNRSLYQLRLWRILPPTVAERRKNCQSLAAEMASSTPRRGAGHRRKKISAKFQAGFRHTSGTVTDAAVYCLAEYGSQRLTLGPAMGRLESTHLRGTPPASADAGEQGISHGEETQYGTPHRIV